MRKLPPLAANVLLLLVTTTVCLVVLEVGARLVLSARPPGRSGEQAAYTRFDSTLGWRNKPGAAVTYNRREYRTRVAINSLGFRDVERSVTKREGTRRILVMGDSFIEAYAVEQDRSVTQRAEMSANRDGCPTEVVNAGVHGYSIDQEYLWYKNEGFALDADVVVMAIYYNDIIHTVRTRYWGSPTPLLEVRDGELTPVNTPLQPPPPAATPPSPPAKRRAEGSALKYFILERLITGAPKLYAQMASVGLVAPYEPETVPDELRVYKKRGQLAEVRAAWARTNDILKAFAGAVRAERAVPVVAYIPASFEVVDNDWDLTLMNYAMQPDAWDRGLVRARLGEFAAGNGSLFLDFTEELREATRGWSGPPYFQHDGHWNDLGNDVAGKALVSFLRRQQLLRCGATGWRSRPQVEGLALAHGRVD
jgi:hypothetical protein